MNEHENFAYNMLSILVILLGVCVIVSLSIIELNEWTFILAIPFILGSTVLAFWGTSISKHKKDTKEVQDE